jgi:Uma2 family endonuclease
MVLSSNQAAFKPGSRRYLRNPVPLVFPTDEEMPEHKIHVELRTALYQLIQLALGDRVIVGSEQFVYWDAANPNRRLAPDLMVWVGAPDTIFGAWKVWERGAPHVAVEIVSPSDKPPGPWKAKLDRYRQCGVPEVVRFDPESATAPLRIWDRIENDLVERDLEAPAALRCDALALYWHIVRHPILGPMLRLARGSDGDGLLPTPEEARQQEAAARQQEAAARQQEAAARLAAEARVAELERELAALRRSEAE